MFIKKIKEKKDKGFTLVETMVAITILLMSIVGPMTLAKQGVASFRLVKNQIVAFYLVQESMEYIRNVRDENILSGVTDWLYGLGDCKDDGSGTNKCIISVVDQTISSCAANCDLLRVSSGGLYGYGAGWTTTQFRREISFVENTSEEIIIEVKIEWDHGRKNFIARNLLFKR